MIKLLIVEDDEQSLYMLKVLLEGHGYEVMHAANGMEALEKATREPPDLVISDILMPVKDGFTLCREWKRDDRFKEIPFIFYTATYTDRKDEEFALNLGAERFLVKPMDPDRFLDSLREVIDAYERKKLVRREPVVEDDSEVYKLYNERLVNKIEKKMLDLEKEVTERKEAENALRESEERYRNLFDSVSDCIYSHDLDGRILAVNKASCRIFGDTPEELIGRCLGDFLAPESNRIFHEEYLPRITENGSSDGIFVFRSTDGKEYHIEYRNALIEDEGSGSYVNGVGRDITESVTAKKAVKNLEKKLIQSQKMKAIGTLAGGIAHDFNNILAAMIGYTELSLLDLPGAAKSRQYLKEVLKAGQRAKDLIRQILAFSRQTDHEKTLLEVAPIVNEAVKLLRASLPATITIRQNIEKNAGIVEVDPTQIHQVLMNLCTNASHAMREKGGVMEVGLKKLDIDAGSANSFPDLVPGPYLRLTVTDTGRGIPPEIISRVFEPYFTTKEMGEGTGLGLAVVHGIVKSCGGTVKVYSEQGKGTTFHVYLPRKPHEEQREETDPAKALPKGKERVLFIDDEQALVDIGRQMLEYLGYGVVARTSSTDALEMFREQPDRFDLIITDTTMPNMTGERFSQEALKIRPDIPVILCTGFSEEITEQKAKDIGVRAYIMKPYVLSEIAEIIRRILNK
ncbi:MAG: response regulator [Desulfobacteraceae bacterium]|nr:MAG: response regulator [Desulfobacteraceae bacterium]